MFTNKKDDKLFCDHHITLALCEAVDACKDESSSRN